MAGTAAAQESVTHRCLSDEMNQRVKDQFPDQVAQNEMRWKQTLDASLGRMNLAQFAKTTFTANDTTTVYHIPLVFHIVHDQKISRSRSTMTVILVP